MNNHDTSNFNFLMNSAESVLNLWWLTLSADDRAYAFELLAQGREDAAQRAAYFVDEVPDCDLARSVLSRFRL
jgi:hypothetical protein